MSTPDLAIAKQFWSAFSPNDPAIRLRFLKADRSLPSIEQSGGDVEAIWPLVVKFQAEGYECYYVAQETDVRAPGHGYGGQICDEDVTGYRALIADFDEGLPATWHQQPDLIVNTSVVEGVQKGQVIWHVLDCNDETSFRDAQERLIAHYGCDEKIKNPARILRLPGSLHQKDQFDPQLVTFTNGRDPSPRTMAALTAGLPKAKARKSKASKADRGTASSSELVSLLPHLDPNMGMNDWLACLSGLKNTDFIGDEINAEDLAVRWSSGEFWKDGLRTDKDGNCVYPGEAEVRKRFKSGIDRGTYGSLRFHAAKGGWSMPREEIIYVYLPQSDAPKQDAKKRPNHWLTRQQQMALSPPSWLISGLIEDGADVQLVAPSQFLKSFLAIELAACVATGKSALGSYAVKRKAPVFYAAGEGGVNVAKKRITAWELEHELEPGAADNVMVATDVPPSGPGMEAKQAEYIEDARLFLGDEKAGLLVIDTMSRSLGHSDEDKSSTANGYLGMLKAWRDRNGGSTLTVHHMGKDRTRGGRGSSAFFAGFDTVLEVIDCTDRVMVLGVTKQKDGEDSDKIVLAAHAVDLPDGGTSLVLRPLNKDEADRVLKKTATVSKDELVSALLALGKGVTTNELATYIVNQRSDGSKLKSIVGDLNRKAKTIFAGYVIGQGARNSTLWGICPEDMKVAA